MKLTLKFKMLIAFGACIALMLILGAASIWSSSRLTGHTREVSAHWLPAVQAAKNMQLAFYEMHMQRMNFIMATDDDQATAIEKRFSEVAADLKAQRDLFATFWTRRDEMAAFDALVAKYAEGHQGVANLVKMGNTSAATAKLKEEMAPTFKALHAQLAQWVAASVAGSQAEADASAATGRNVQWLTLTGLVASVLLACGVSLLITRNVMRQLGGDPSYAFSVVTEIVDGNLAIKVDTRPDDKSSLLFAIKGMATSLADMVTNVNDCAMTIRGATREVASGNLDFSSRTEHQSSKLQATASSMTKLDLTVRHADDGVQQADTLAQGASSVATEGGEVMGQVVRTMKDINDSSRKIADITGVIDSIAFQTNILALNAAVEAARAGEQGRGFAVVASEVRSLAQRCAGAAKDIKTLIGASVERVEQGTGLVDRAGAKMGDVVTAIQRVSQVMGDIKSASEQQRAEVSQIGMAVSDMEQTTQQNAALVEECAASAESLNVQVEKLLAAVSAFRLPEARRLATA